MIWLLVYTGVYYHYFDVSSIAQLKRERLENEINNVLYQMWTKEGRQPCPCLPTDGSTATLVNFEERKFWLKEQAECDHLFGKPLRYFNHEYYFNYLYISSTLRVYAKHFENIHGKGPLLGKFLHGNQKTRIIFFLSLSCFFSSLGGDPKDFPL